MFLGEKCGRNDERKEKRRKKLCVKKGGGDFREKSQKKGLEDSLKEIAHFVQPEMKSIRIEKDNETTTE